MGAFCVFGISRTACKIHAEKKQPTRCKETRREFTVEEFAERCDALAEAIFNEQTRRVKVSPEFDAPQFCKSWLAVDPAHIKLPKIMCRGAKIDKKGNIVVRNGSPVISWIEYEEPKHAI